MPRLDNSNCDVLEVYGLEFDPNDPGKTPPVDLCDDCSNSWLNANIFIDHPEYGNDIYICTECGTILTSFDD